MYHEISADSETRELATGLECAELGAQGEKAVELEGEGEMKEKEDKENKEDKEDKEEKEKKEVLVQSEDEIAELEGWGYK